MTERGPRERTVRAAALLIRDRGVAGTGMREIVERAQAPRGSLQHYFPGGKDQIVAEALALTSRWATRALEQALASEPPPSPKQAVNVTFGLWREWLSSSEYGFGCALVATVAGGAAAPEVRQAVVQGFGEWIDLLERALQRGGIRRPRARRLATLVVSAVEGAVVMSRAQQSTVPLDDTERELVLLLG